MAGAQHQIILIGVTFGRDNARLSGGPHGQAARNVREDRCPE
jgi:hypothetical protein